MYRVQGHSILLDGLPKQRLATAQARLPPDPKGNVIRTRACASVDKKHIEIERATARCRCRPSECAQSPRARCHDTWHRHLQLEQDEGEDGTIYHLITSTPHLHDVSASGPYHSIDAVYEQLGANFGKSYRSGTETALELYNDGALDAAEHITAAMYGHPNWTKKCRIIREPNAVVKATLPGEAYVVNSTDFNTELADGAVPGAVRAMDVHGTFADVDSAVERARQIAQQMAEEVEGGSMVEGPREQSGFRRTYCVRSSTRSGVFIVVGVRLDTGVIYTPPA